MKYILLSLFFPFFVYATNLESYQQRPKIETLQISSLNVEQKQDVEKLVKPLLSGVALLLTSFPKNTHFYFLARDAEYIYDIARLLAPNDEFKSRLHLINVSTFLSTNTKLKLYLAQNKLSEERLSKGQKNVFIETGFLGTVPDFIKSHFSAKFSSSFYLMMFQSDSLKYNSIYSIKNYISVEGLERYPHFTSTAFDYRLEKDVYVPVSKVQESITKKSSLELMEAITSALSNREYKNYFKSLLLVLQNKNYKNTDLSETLIKDLRKDMENIKSNCNFCNQSIKRLSAVQKPIIDNRSIKTFSPKEVKSLINQFILYFAEYPEHKLRSTDKKLIAEISNSITSNKEVFLLEDLVLSLLPVLVAEKDFKLNQLLLKTGLKYVDGEELIEKMLWVISKDKKHIEIYENLLIQVVKNLSVLDKPEIGLRILKENFSLFFNQRKLLNLENHVNVAINNFSEEKKYYFSSLKENRNLKCKQVFK